MDLDWANILLTIRALLKEIGASAEQLNRLDAHIANMLDIEYPPI